MSYQVDEVTETHLTVKDPQGSARTLTRTAAAQFLKRPYCRTGHSTQGLSLGARIYVHDWKSHMASHRWIRTVMSRCGTLDIILVNGSEGARSDYIDINKRIVGHIKADKAKQFAWKAEDYVTTEWVVTCVRNLWMRIGVLIVSQTTYLTSKTIAWCPAAIANTRAPTGQLAVPGRHLSPSPSLRRRSTPWRTRSA